MTSVASNFTGSLYCLLFTVITQAPMRFDVTDGSLDLIWDPDLRVNSHLDFGLHIIKSDFISSDLKQLYGLLLHNLCPFWS